MNAEPQYTQEQLELARMRIELLEECQRYRDQHPREFVDSGYWYGWQHESFEAPEPQVCVLAGNRCISPWTPIETPDGSVPILEFVGETEFDVVSWGDGSRCVQSGSGVFLKGIEPMFRFRTDTGQFFDCSRMHRVLTQFGWISADLIMWLLSGRHWLDTVAGFGASYGEGVHRHGQPLRQASGSDRRSFPLPVDAPSQSLPSHIVLSRHDAVSRVDAAVREYQCNPTSQDRDRHSTEDDPAWLLDLSSRFPNPDRNDEYDVPLCSQKRQDARLRLFESSPHLQSDGVIQIGRDQSISASDFLVGGNRIVSISYIGFQPILDFTVEKTACYVSAGVVHHNTGKTHSAGYHVAVDVTGDYPDWWVGYRFTHAPNVLVSGVDNIQLKDVVQKELFGVAVERNGKKTFTGGWIHPEEIGRITWSKVTTDLAVSVEVKSKLPGIGMVRLRSYTQTKSGQGTLSFAGYSLDRVWVDECPPDDLVGQLIVRLGTGNMGRGGRITYTMTPELGKTGLVTTYMEDRKSTQRLVGPVQWDDCKHLNPEVQKMMLEGIPEHEHDMRRRGLPFFGSGLIYNVADNRIKCTPETEAGKPITSIPWLRYIRAIDIGIDHPTAIAWLAYDSEIDRIYVLRTYAERGGTAADHAAAANSYLEFAPMVFPHDIDVREKGSGKTIRRYYEDAGIKNTRDFKNPDGSRAVEAGIQEIKDRMKSDRFKVFDVGCDDFWREKRAYHRKDGRRVDKDDDVMDAVRYGAMMIQRYGVQMGGNRVQKPARRKRFKWSK